ncbi:MULTISPECIES: hypothetical protein [Ruegeria]|uniref:Uncharacterized protein n=1 Tax=Ruegeria atlantica TaxID=81569 RepID=A0A0P1ESZ2_9RHOB|nr:MULTISPECIES: hypothetical protein [Ruegeria]CUH44822.1 hypothetical protein RUM4293_03728 [Ruegeria atlantica]
MTSDLWFEILSRASPNRPEPLDDLINEDRDAKPLGKVIFPNMRLAPSLMLWDREPGGPVHIGVRVHEPPETPYRIARLLAAAAMEREVFPVILSRVDYCGLERFGFRVERVPEEAAAAQAAEEEIRKYWDLAIIIDGHEIGLLG